jgi:glycerophosphoryl diester phosphodiesterase
VEYSAEDVDLLDNWTFTAEEFTRPPQPNPFSPFDLIRLTSSIPGLIQLRHPPSVKIGDRSFPLQKGIHLLYKQRGQFLFETHVNEDQPHALAKKINQLMKDKRYFIVLANSFVNGFSAKDKALLTRLGFPILAKMNGKDAYIAYAYEGFARECWDAQTFSLLLPQQAEVRRSRKEIQQDAKDVKRFIAHAGGKIDGHTYTNSLEALNHSYKQGFRLFELDIMKTSDGTYVAVHNWEEWKSMTNYQGPFPVSRDTFLHYPLLGKYTPMDIHAINQWFSDHSDAILVTDKVNEADAFIAEFIDRKRLMMELFSLEEVMAAKKAGILGVMPSMHVINAMIGDKVAQLKALDIHYMTFSRYHLETNRDLLMEAKKNGIKTFVYNVNYAFGKDEAYVLCNELDLAFGMYADHWDFNH